MQTVTPRKIRNAKIVEMATNGVGISSISETMNISKSAVTRTLELEQSQGRLRECLDDIESRVNSELPELLTSSLSVLKETLELPFVDRSDRLKAAKIVLDTALVLSKITSRSSPTAT